MELVPWVGGASVLAKVEEKRQQSSHTDPSPPMYVIIMIKLLMQSYPFMFYYCLLFVLAVSLIMGLESVFG